MILGVSEVLHFMLSLLHWVRPSLGLATIFVIAFGELGSANTLDLTDQRNRKLSFSQLPERLVIIPIPAPSTFMTIDGGDRKIVGMNDYAAREGPSDSVQALIDQIPGAEAAIDASRSGGGLSRLMGGGLMAVGTRLMGLGLGMSDIQKVARELFRYGRDKIGADQMGKIIAGTPGLSQFA